jgi:hypothetical protein
MNDLKTSHMQGEFDDLIRFVMINRRGQSDLDPPPSRRITIELQGAYQMHTSLCRQRLFHCRTANRRTEGNENAIRR